MDQLREACEQIIEMGRSLVTENLTIGTWGNISCLVPDKDYIAITPSGMKYESLVIEDIVILDRQGTVIRGKRKPSIEVPLHLAIYCERNDVRATIHSHSPYATAMAAARKEIPGAVEDLVQIVGGNVKVNEYALPGSEQLGKSVLKGLDGRNAVLLANHGMVGVGKDLDEALKVCKVVEKAAQITLLAQLVGGVVELSQDEICEMRKFYLESYGQDK